MVAVCKLGLPFEADAVERVQPTETTKLSLVCAYVGGVLHSVRSLYRWGVPI